jgi:putative RecB family exonuclease
MSEQERHLSYSQINTYTTCPLRYNFQYVEQTHPAFTAASLAFGSAIHEAAAAFYQSRLEGDELRLDQLLDVYRDAWRAKDNVKFFRGDNEDALLEQANRMLTAFCEASDPSVTILGVEEFFELPLGGLPPFHGYIDLIEQSADGTIAIVDLKTAAKKPTDASVCGNLQLTAYSLGAEVLGFEPEALRFRLDVLTKNKNSEMVRYATGRTEDDRHRFIKLVYQVWKGIERGVWFPREDWHCQQCAYAEACKKW